MTTNPFAKNKYEIYYNILNAGLAGLLVFIGAFADGNISSPEIVAAIGSSLTVAVIKFRDYWNNEKKEYSKFCFNFL